MANHLRLNHGYFRNHCRIGGGMAYFYRLIFVCFVGVVSWLPASSFAFPATADPKPPTCVGDSCRVDWKSAYNPTYFATPAEACAVIPAAWPGHFGSCNYSSPTMYYFVWSQGEGTDSVQSFRQVTYTPTYSCPANSTLSGSSCSCNASYSDGGGYCVVVPPTCSAGQMLNPAQDACIPRTCTLPQVLNPDASACITPSTNDSRCQDQALLASMAFGQARIVVKGSGSGLCVETSGNSAGVGCNVVLADVITYKYADGTIWTDGYPKYVMGAGQTCAVPSEPTPEKPIKLGEAVKSCSGGQQGQVNGLTVCLKYPAGTTATTALKTTTVGQNGVTGLPEVKSSVSSNVCLNGTCTTSTTTTTNTGGVTTIVNNEPVTTGGVNDTSLDSKTGAKSEYCTAHPKDSQCGQLGDGGSNFSGVCGQPPACDGDAVMCAIAAATFQTNCALNPPPSPESALYDEAKTLTGNQIKGLPGASSVSISSADFSTANIIGGGSGGLSDLNVTVFRSQISLPFSQLNIWLERLGRIMQAVTFLLCIRIIARG